MSSDLRFDGGSSASWRVGTIIGVDLLFGGIYGLREQGTEVKGDFRFANCQPNLGADPSTRSGRYRQRISVPV